MKKLIAVFLAALLSLAAISCPALAESESVQFTLSMRLGEDAFQEAMLGEEWLDEEWNDQMASMLQAVLQLYESVQCRVQLQPDGIRLALMMQEEEFLSAAVTWSDDEVSLVSSLIPGYRLTLSTKELREAFEAVDWLSLFDALADVTDTWLAARDAVTEAGSFAGNAYSGGTARTTYTLDDRDIATLFEGYVLCLEERQDVVKLLNVDLFGGEDNAAAFFHAIRQMNYQVAMNSAYNYTLAVVRDADSGLVGYSLNVFEGDVLLGALSLGWDGDALKGVVSVPLGETIAYVDFRIGETTLTYSARQAAAGASYEAACQDDDTLRTSYESEYVTRYESPLIPGKGMEQSGTSTEIMYNGGKQDVFRMEEQMVMSTSPFRYDDVMTQYLNGNMLLEMKILGEECEPFTTADGLTTVDMMNISINEESALGQAVEDGAMDMMIKLFKYLPTDFIRPMMELLTELEP